MKTNNEDEEQQQRQKQNTSSSSSMVVTQEGNSRLEVQSGLASRFLNDRNISIAQEVSKIAKKIGRSAAQVALNWIRQQNITSLAWKNKNKIIPIIGARKESQIKDNLACLEFELTSEQMKRLNEVSPIELGFPHDFLNSERLKDIIYGSTYSLINNTDAVK